MASDEGRTQKATEMRIGFNEDLNDVLFERIASLESQIREKDERIKQYNTLLDPILDWGHSPESGLKLGQSITKEVLRMAKESKEKDKEIDRLREIIKSKDIIQEDDALLIGDLREALTQALVKAGHQMHDDLVDKCRKLIGD